MDPRRRPSLAVKMGGWFPELVAAFCTHLGDGPLDQPRGSRLAETAVRSCLSAPLSDPVPPSILEKGGNQMVVCLCVAQDCPPNVKPSLNQGREKKDARKEPGRFNDGVIRNKEPTPRPAGDGARRLADGVCRGYRPRAPGYPEPASGRAGIGTDMPLMFLR